MNKMETIDVNENYLNIDYLAIYFISRQANDLKDAERWIELNKYKAYTFGIYEYKILYLDIDSKEYQSIPSDIMSKIDANNVVIRLFNNTDNHVTYMLENINFDCDSHEFYLNRHLDISYICFRDKANIKEHIHNLWNEDKKGNYKRIKKLEVILYKMVNGCQTTTMGNIKCDIKSSIDPSYLSKLKIQRMPNLYIERIPTLRYKKEVMRYGVVVEIEGKRTPVMLNGTDQKMLYITALLRYKAGIPLYLHELYNNSRGSKAADIKVDRSKMKEWLTEVYNTIIDNDGNDAESWLNMVARAGKQNLNGEEKVRKSHPLPQAKSEANKRIENSLSGNPSAIDCCVLKTVMDENNVTYYSFDIPMEKIFLDEQLQHLLDKFLTYIKKD
jgi:hypothetical protein